MNEETQFEKAVSLLRWAEELLEMDNRPEAESWRESLENWEREEKGQGRI